MIQTAQTPAHRFFYLPPDTEPDRLEQAMQRAIAQLAFTYIIKNWESQDEPEHLRTIRDRIVVSFLALWQYHQARINEIQALTASANSNKLPQDFF